MTDSWNRPVRLKELNPLPRHTDVSAIDNAGFTRVGRAPRIHGAPCMAPERADRIEGYMDDMPMMPSDEDY
jgi:hypothetical protein